MKALFLLLSFFWILGATENKNELHLHILSGGIVSTKIIVSVLNTIGQRVNITRYDTDGKSVEMEMIVSGRKAFEAKIFRALLSESGITITKGSVKNKNWFLEMDASTAVWNVSAISVDEGVQLEKSAHPFWYTVENIKAVSIEAAYGGKWYPDISVMDANMNILGSLRTFIPREQMNFSLPDGSRYLKVSSTNGMKLVKEGTWIESINGR